MGYLAREVRQSNIFPLKKSGFQLLSQKTCRRSFVHQKTRPRSIETLPVQLSKKQTDPTNAFVGDERQISETQ